MSLEFRIWKSMLTYCFYKYRIKEVQNRKQNLFWRKRCWTLVPRTRRTRTANTCWQYVRTCDVTEWRTWRLSILSDNQVWTCFTSASSWQAPWWLKYKTKNIKILLKKTIKKRYSEETIYSLNSLRIELGIKEKFFF